MTQPTATEAELWMELHDAMDGNLSMSKRRTLLAAYKATVLDEAADAVDARQDKLDAEIRTEYGELDRDTELEGAATRRMAAHLRRMAEEARS